jgi:GPH family glycoside/pentoside/hexuronide:cation symporter
MNVSLPLKGRAGKLSYAFGAIGDTGFYQVINGWLLFFLTQRVLLDPWLAGLAFAISFGVLNAISAPFIGSLSDRVRTRFGRRRPFIMIGAPLTILFFVLLWSPPTGGKPLAEPMAFGVFLFIIIILGAWAWTYSMAAVTWFALFPEMWESVKDRSEVVMYRQIFGVVGGALAVAVFPILVAIMSGRFGEFNGWIWAGFILGVIFAGAYLSSLLGIKERKEFSADKSLPMGKAIIATFSNKTLRIYVVIDLMTWCMTGWLSATMPYFVTKSLGLAEGDVALLMAPSMIGIFAFFLIWRAVYIRYGPKVTLATAITTFTLSFLPCLYVNTVLQGALWAFFVGAAMGGVLLAREVMMGDVVDEDEINTGVRREGSCFGAFIAIEKISFVIIGFSIAVLLSVFIGYVPGKPEPAFMNMGIRIGMFLFISIYMIIALIFLSLYPLGKEKVSILCKQIEELHLAKAKKLEKTAKTDDPIKN